MGGVSVYIMGKEGDAQDVVFWAFYCYQGFSGLAAGTFSVTAKYLHQCLKKE